MRTLLTILITLNTLLIAQEPSPAPVNLETVPSYRQGLAALADHLPEQAVIRLNEAYTVKGLSPEQNQTILIKLAEAQVRANQPDDALKTLSNKFLKDYPTTDFWTAQALAAKGELKKAITALLAIDIKSENYPQARLTAANLSLAIGDTDAAIQLFNEAAKLKDKDIQQRANIALAEIYLTLNDLDEAKQTLTNTSSSRAAQLTQYLLARTAHKQEKFAEAIAIYRQLIDASANLPKRLFDLTLLGLIDARKASGDTPGAITETIETINQYPEASTLPELLERLTTWSPQDLPETSPTITRLRDWAGRAPNPNAPIPLYPNTGSVVQMPPSFGSIPNKSETLKSLTQYYYAKILSKSNSVGTLDKALFELSVFRLLNPSHPLVADSLLLTAQNHLKKQNPTSAIIALSSLQQLADANQITLPLPTQSQAAFTRGMLLIKQENFPAALKSFELASLSNSKEFAKSASINAGLAALRSADLESFQKQQNKIGEQSLKIELAIEKALWMAQTKHPAARTELNNFILNNPEHPRVTEAKIALASICATQPPLNPLMGNALLTTIEPNALSTEQFTHYSRTKYQLDAVEKNWPQAIATTEQWLAKFPNDTNKPEFSMRKGLALYRNGEHNKARQVLGQLAQDHPKSPLTTLALYYTAMAARLEATPQAQLESVDIFEKIINTQHPIAIEARIQQARLLIDLDKIEQAIKSLTSVYDKKSTTPQQREIAILLAAALHTQGSTDPQNYQKAIAIYDQLLINPNLSLGWSNRIHFLKGQALENTNTEASKKAALDTYYQVINRENRPKNTPPEEQEWHWFYRSAFKALTMLEKSDRPKAAIAIAKKIASYKDGPRAKEAADRARALEMEHMIWDK